MDALDDGWVLDCEQILEEESEMSARERLKDCNATCQKVSSFIK